MLSAATDFLAYQQALQQELRCDYVIIVYEKVPPATGTRPNGPPMYNVSRSIPVKLSHSVFMQMSIGILKDRLVSQRPVGKSVAGGKHSTLGSENDAAVLRSDTGSPKWSPFALDLVGLFTFLSNYAKQFESCRREVEQANNSTRRTGGANNNSSNSKGAVTATQSPPIPSGAIRFQLLVEYGIDVLQVQRDVDLPTLKKYWSEQVSQEEFYNQIGKPSGMAQECSIM